MGQRKTTRDAANAAKKASLDHCHSLLKTNVLRHGAKNRGELCIRRKQDTNEYTYSCCCSNNYSVAVKMKANISSEENEAGPTHVNLLESVEIENTAVAEGNPLGLQYKIDDNPPWPLCIFLGLQHYLTMFGATVAVPFILAPHLCIDKNPLILSEVISTIFFASGIATLLQSTIGNRLPIVQGATFSFLGPTIAILSLPQFSCKDSLNTNHTNGTFNSTATTTTQNPGNKKHHDWRIGMLEVQGSIMVASLLQVAVGFSGFIGLIIRYVGPLTIAPTIAIIGLSLFDAAATFSSKNWGIASMTVLFVILFSQVIHNLKVPLPWISSTWKCTIVWSPLFKLFPILFAIILSWILSAIITAAGGFPYDSKKPGYLARTDARSYVLNSAKWFRVPYPGQWGRPTVHVTGVVGMFAGILASMIESVGDYYACARLSGAPPPPKHAINRGIGIEGIGCIVAGALGSGNGTTSASENIGAIGMTKVGSRRVIQCGAIIMIILACFGKFGALFTTIPDPIIGAMFWSLFGMILAIGLSNLQFIDLNSSRNLFVLGFSFFTGMVVPEWIKKNTDAIDTGLGIVLKRSSELLAFLGALQTKKAKKNYSAYITTEIKKSSKEADEIIEVLLKTNMAISGCIAMILDNLLPGTDEERGLKKWRRITSPQDSTNDTQSSMHVYDPLGITSVWVGKKWLKFVPFLPYYDKPSLDRPNEPDEHNNEEIFELKNV
eukprot:gene3770-4292_t